MTGMWNTARLPFSAVSDASTVLLYRLQLLVASLPVVAGCLRGALRLIALALL